MFHEIVDQIKENARDGRFREIMERFKATADPLAKILIIDELEQNGCFQRPQILPRMAKSNEKSKVYRTLGNDQFQVQTNEGYLAALKHYNKSICYAENDSEELGLAFWNRSAVYFELGLYDDCIENIKIARQFVPSRLTDKLNNREADCLKRKRLVKTTNPAPSLNPTLSFPANARIPFIANCLKLEKNEQYGRHIITTTDLKPGDVVAVEDAYCSTLHKKFQYMRCENCLKENNYNLMPCPHCVSVMFCGTCYDEAFEKFHKFECPIIDLIAQLICGNPFITITLRTVVRAITNFNSVEAMVTFVEETRGQDLTIFDCDYTEQSLHYAPVHFSAESWAKYVPLDFYVLASLISRYLLELTDLKDMFVDERATSIIKELILHHLKRKQDRYAGSLYCTDTDFLEYATGVHPFRDLLNHSCASNLMISSTGSKFVYTVSKPIKAGEQLFDNYNTHFKDNTLEKRQQTLIEQYRFRCECKACNSNYRLKSDMGRGPNIPELRVLHPLSLDSLKLCSAYLIKYNRYYPCKKLLFAETEFGCQLELIYETETPMETRYR